MKNKPDESLVRDNGVEDRRTSGSEGSKQKPAPAAPPPAHLDETPDDAAKGRDRLIENEDRRMDPGVSDSAHS